MDWFLYDNGLRLEKVNGKNTNAEVVIQGSSHRRCSTKVGVLRTSRILQEKLCVGVFS